MFKPADADYPNKDHKIACLPDDLIVGSADTIYESGEKHLQHPPFVMSKDDYKKLQLLLFYLCSQYFFICWATTSNHNMV